MMLWMIGCLLLEPGDIYLPGCAECETAESQLDELINPGFEWSDEAPNGWNIWPGEPENVSISTEVALEGRNALRFTAPGYNNPEEVWVSQRFSAQAGESFFFEVYALSSEDDPIQGESRFNATLGFYNSAGHLIESAHSSWINSSSEHGVWHHLTVMGVAPEEAEEVSTLLDFRGCYHECGELGTVYVDQASFERP